MARERKLPLPKAGIDSRGIKWIVKFDRDQQEWQVRAYKRSAKTGAWKFAEGPTCYCFDRDDAIQTFHHLVGYGPGYERANPKKRAQARARIRARVKRMWRGVRRHVGRPSAYPAFGRRALRTLKLSGMVKRRNPTKIRAIRARIGGKLYIVRIKSRR